MYGLFKKDTSDTPDTLPTWRMAGKAAPSAGTGVIKLVMQVWFGAAKCLCNCCQKKS